MLKSQSGFFTVKTDTGLVVCRLRGSLLKERLDTDPCAVGDRVTLTLLDDGKGVIEEVAERERVLSRNATSPGGRGGESVHREQVILANPDQAVFVFSNAQPSPNSRTLDRLLVAAEKSEVDHRGRAYRLCLLSALYQKDRSRSPKILAGDRPILFGFVESRFVENPAQAAVGIQQRLTEIRARSWRAEC